MNIIYIILKKDIRKVLSEIGL